LNRDGLYYTGVTNDVEVRIAQHNEGANKTSFTYKRRPVVLKYWQRFSDINHAISWEKQLKGLEQKKERSFV